MSSFAGLPVGPTNPGAAKRATVKFTIPKKHVGADWAMGDEFLVVHLAEITPHEQLAAAKLAGRENPALLSQELTFKTIKLIGTADPHRDRAFLESWWKQVGPKVRRLIEAAFLRMSSVTEADIDTFLDSGEPVGPSEG